ncbi:septum formation initiator family protein [Ensifer adhaerens]|jgi:cell division protein FtsB|uniref:Septum formation initiator family protein n=1 Tax=Ensifer adhaerens TaxID=106592 RepID=A0A9Q8YBD9_ENSAD|nr:MULTISPECIES: septum formation initiator family protein [Ensifer]OWZ92026.1 cell division protein [Sinorhizobium sp. LM21]ANK72222.1 cell division protein [Ensifer adhaerens]KDP74342.1 cell division protein [Ensifer adhaerens]KQX21121.1 cell division protein [Ensifer sp. Root423]KQX58322.1 cell division protein [Ensifer sp. Root1298]
MWTRHHKKRKLGRLVMPLIAVAFLSYFGYHSIHGGYGLKATEQFDRQIVERQARLDKLTKQRMILEKEVQLMSDGSLERDMLDEKARLALNMSRSDEIVIFHRAAN